MIHTMSEQKKNIYFKVRHYEIIICQSNQIHIYFKKNTHLQLKFKLIDNFSFCLFI
jgi:hypothetical protein